MTTLLRTTEQFRKSESKFGLESEIIRFFEQLDIDGLTNLVNQEDLFEESIKWRLLAIYKKIFTNIRAVLGSNELKSKCAICNGCEVGREVISFVNQFGYSHFSIYFKKVNGVLTEVAQCTDIDGDFSTLLESIPLEV